MIIKGVTMKKIFTLLGSFFVFLGVLGLFLPIVPTVPFLIIALFFYSKGSRKHYNWLIRNKLFGKYIKNYNERKGIPLHGKILGIIALWVSIAFSGTVFVTNNVLRIVMVIVALVVTVHLLRLKTLPN